MAKNGGQIMTNTKNLKKEYAPGGDQRDRLLARAVQFLIDPKLGDLAWKRNFLEEKLGLTNEELLVVIQTASEAQQAKEEK